MKIKEFNIPVPWGHISVKAWGDSFNTPVLVTHGIMDNAGSFDCLIPLLPNVFYYICIDLPGHGRSSHFPPFFPIYTLNFVIVYKLVLDYFNRKKYILLGHSYGALIGQYFARFYPEYVEKIINIDCITAHHIEPDRLKDYHTKRYNYLIAIYKKGRSGQETTYTEEEIIEKIRNNRLNEPIGFEAAKCIARRMLQEVGNGRYTLSTDDRLKVHFSLLHSFTYTRDTLELYPVTCPYLLILAKQSPPLLSDMHPLLKDVKKWGNTTIILLDAGHDVHINHPEIVVFHITEFLMKTEPKL